jgi:hypothetical protein
VPVGRRAANRIEVRAAICQTSEGARQAWQAAMRDSNSALRASLSSLAGSKRQVATPGASASASHGVQPRAGQHLSWVADRDLHVGQAELTRRLLRLDSVP